MEHSLPCHWLSLLHADINGYWPMGDRGVGIGPPFRRFAVFFALFFFSLFFFFSFFVLRFLHRTLHFFSPSLPPPFSSFFFSTVAVGRSTMYRLTDSVT